MLRVLLNHIAKFIKMLIEAMCDHLIIIMIMKDSWLYMQFPYRHL